MLFRLTKAIVRYLIQVGAGGGQPLFVGSPAPNDLSGALTYGLYNGDDPAVVDLVFNGTIGGVDLDAVPGLASLSAPSWTAAPGNNYFSITNNLSLSSVALPALALVGGFTCVRNSALAALNVAALSVVGSGAFNCYENPLLTSFSLPALVSVDGNISLDANAFTEATVDAILVKLASIGWAEAGRTVDLSGGTNSPPGTAGLTAKGILEGLGATVLVN